MQFTNDSGFFHTFEGFSVEIMNYMLQYHSSWRAVNSLGRTCKAGTHALAEVRKRHSKFGLGYLDPSVMFYVQQANTPVIINAIDANTGHVDDVEIDANVIDVPIYVDECLVALQLALQHCIDGVSIISIAFKDVVTYTYLLRRYFPNSVTGFIKNRSIVMVSDVDDDKYLTCRMQGVVLIIHHFDVIRAYQRFIDIGLRKLNAIVDLHRDSKCNTDYISSRESGMMCKWINACMVPIELRSVEPHDCSLRITYHENSLIEAIKYRWTVGKMTHLVVIASSLNDACVGSLAKQIHTFVGAPQLTIVESKRVICRTVMTTPSNPAKITYDSHKLNRFSHIGGIMLVKYEKASSIACVRSNLAMRVLADHALVYIDAPTIHSNLKEMYSFAETLCSCEQRLPIEFHIQKCQGLTLTRCCLIDCDLSKGPLNRSELILERGIDNVMQMSKQERIALLMSKLKRSPKKREEKKVNNTTEPSKK